MLIIKLDATDSTNDYLKQLCKVSDVENYIIVMANEQTKGKGQMGAKWLSEKGKNLTMSILVKGSYLKKESVFDLNCIVALAVVTVLKKIQIPAVSIKWPNDILSDSKKVAGILIENSFKPDGSFHSIIGIGLNINQTNFDHLPQATSLTSITGKVYDLENIALQIAESIKEYFSTANENAEMYWEEYHNNLYKINYPSAFEDTAGNRFMGIIKKVTKDGKLTVLLENESLVHYEVKQIKMLY